MKEIKDEILVFYWIFSTSTFCQWKLIQLPVLEDQICTIVGPHKARGPHFEQPWDCYCRFPSFYPDILTNQRPAGLHIEHQELQGFLGCWIQNLRPGSAESRPCCLHLNHRPAAAGWFGCERLHGDSGHGKQGGWSVDPLLTINTFLLHRIARGVQ